MAAGKKVTMSLSEKVYNILEHLAEEKGVTKSSIIALALIEYADRQKG